MDRQKGPGTALTAGKRSGGTADPRGNILICSCEDTIPLDADAVRRGCKGAQVTTARQLCRAELDRFRAMARQSASLTVGCTQEAPLFTEVASEVETADAEAAIAYANI